MPAARRAYVSSACNVCILCNRSTDVPLRCEPLRAVPLSLLSDSKICAIGNRNAGLEEGTPAARHGHELVKCKRDQITTELILGKIFLIISLKSYLFEILSL